MRTLTHQAQSIGYFRQAPIRTWMPSPVGFFLGRFVLRRAGAVPRPNEFSAASPSTCSGDSRSFCPMLPRSTMPSGNCSCCCCCCWDCACPRLVCGLRPPLASLLLVARVAIPAPRARVVGTGDWAQEGGTCTQRTVKIKAKRLRECHRLYCILVELVTIYNKTSREFKLDQ